MAKIGKNKGRDQVEGDIRAMRAQFQAVPEEKPEKTGGKGKLVKILILLTVVIAIGSAAGGVWFVFFKPSDNPEPEVVEAESEVYEKTYLEARPVHIAFEQTDGRRRRLVVYLILEVEQRENNVSDVKQAMPRLQEAFWRTLNAEPLPGAGEGAIELSAVKERIRSETERVLGPRVVSDVLIRDARLVRG